MWNRLHARLSSAGQGCTKLRSVVSEASHHHGMLLIYLVGAWLLCGITFYKYSNDWSWATAYYYAVEVGYGVGYSNLGERDEDSIHAFTVVYVMLGTLLIYGIWLYYFLHLFQHPTLPGANNSYAENLPPLNYLLKIVLLESVVCFMIWVAIGVAFCMVSEQWSFVTAVYFAVTSCSPAGVKSLPCASRSTEGSEFCEIASWKACFLASYILLGVPCEIVTNCFDCLH
jgi:hypothetical protein